ncbi:hypothetical protein ABVB72_04650 [Rhizobium nepotum]|uniref:hypothetical protein n=1 Tax=Rhizobium nepotum TaxID=1035271 RepID=UPI00336AD4A3
MLYGTATPLKAFACAAPRPLASAELSAADTVIRATLQNYEILVPGMKARLTLNVVEQLKGSVLRDSMAQLRKRWLADSPEWLKWRDGSISVLWESSTGQIPNRWEGSNDVIAALKRLKPSTDDAAYQVIHPNCGPPSILWFSALNVWRIMRETGDR